MKIKLTEYYRLAVDNTHKFVGHTHNSCEVNIVLKGNLEVIVNNNVLILGTSDMALWSPMMFHCDRVVSKRDTEYLSLHFEIEKDTLPKDFIGFYRLDHSNLMLVNVLLDEIEQNGKIISDAAQNLFTALLLRSKRDDRKPEFSKQTTAIIYRDAVDLMTQNSNCMFSICQIAHYCGVCETILKNAFKQYTGKSIKKYYQELKMQKARELLKCGKSAKEIAVDLGYSSLSYFSQSFKRENGCGIREYIKNCSKTKS